MSESLRLGTRVKAAAEFDGSGAVTLTLDDQDAAARWDVEIQVTLAGRSGWWKVRSVRSNAGGGSRVIAVACVPGAVGWRIEARRFAGTGLADLHAEASPACTPGVFLFDAT